MSTHPNDWFSIPKKHLFDECPPSADPEKWAAYRSELKRTENFELLDYPLQLDIELNGGCNMACPFCTHSIESVPNIMLPTDKYERIVREAVSLGTKSIKLNYINEPLMRADLESFIKFAVDAGIVNVYLVTNGTLLTKARSKRLIEAGLTRLFVSIDAVTDETYSKQRLSGQFENVVRNVRQFISVRDQMRSQFPLVVVSFLKNQLNIHEREEFGDQWSDVADIVSFQTMNEIPDHESGIVLEYESVPQCKFPFKQIVVDYHGSIYPCCKLAGKGLKLGTIDTISIKDAWRIANPIRTAHHESDGKKFSACRKCMGAG